jgi:hypothetical protein
MNIKGSRKWWLSIGATLGMLILLWAIGAAMAQGPGSEGGVQPQGDASIAATVNSRISYQGVLEESGQPVTGNRDMTFNLYTNDTCSGIAVYSTTENDVPVTDGLFSVELDVTHGVFWGQGLWLEVEVEGTDVGCEEILPVPYALSLRPGAEIQGEPTAWEGWVLKVDMDGTYPLAKAVWASTATGSAVRGDSTGGWGMYGSTEDGYAVHGHDGGTTQARGYAGYFLSLNGVGVYGHSGAERTVSNNYAPGVYGHSENGVGVYGTTDATYGLYTPDSLYVAGTCSGSATCNEDIAEYVDAELDVEPGDVVIAVAPGMVGRSTQPNDTRVLGIISTNPAIVFPGGTDGAEGEGNRLPLALAGVAPCKVSAENGPIAVGDLLITSGTPGHAMRAGASPRVGTVIGKALEELDEGTGIILVLVTLQ